MYIHKLYGLNTMRYLSTDLPVKVLSLSFINNVQSHDSTSNMVLMNYNDVDIRAERGEG